VKTPKIGADDFIAAGLGEELPRQPRTPLGSVQPVELHALLGRTYSDPPAIIGAGIMPRQGLGILGGPPKRGKSLLTLQQVFARALAWPWLGFPTTPGRSLVIQSEIPERELQTRVALMLASLSVPIPVNLVHFVTHRGLRLDRPDGLRLCRTLIETLEPDFVLFDPLARFFSGDENSTRDVGRLVAVLDELIQAYGIAIEVVHHTAKPSSDDPREGGQRLRGNSALFAAADSVLILDRDGVDSFKLGFELRHGREPDPMRLRRSESLWLEPAGPPDDLLEVATIVASLPLTWGRFVDAIKADRGVSRPTAGRLIQRALQDGLIGKNGDGTYHSTVSRLTPSQDSVRQAGSSDG